jgi:phosphate acetyltransferase
MDLISRIIEKAKKNKKRIVLPESFEERTLKAADIIIQDNVADIILIGNKDKILKKASLLNLKYIEKAQITDPVNSEKLETYANLMVEIRKNKGLTKDQALNFLSSPLYMASIMVKNDDADGEVAGAENSTSNVLRPALQLIKTKPGVSIVSGCFLFILPDDTYGDNGILLYADCAVNPEPTTEQLAEIAITSAQTIQCLADIEPKIAMLSFSTKGSASHETVDKMRIATEIVRKKEPALLIDGELQVDAAIVKSVAEKKAPCSIIEGNANTLIFPDLNSGNIGYKLTERLGKAQALGPILQGINSPVNDVSRGCTVDDLVKIIAITSIQAINK